MEGTWKTTWNLGLCGVYISMVWGFGLEVRVLGVRFEVQELGTVQVFWGFCISGLECWT